MTEISTPRNVTKQRNLSYPHPDHISRNEGGIRIFTDTWIHFYENDLKSDWGDVAGSSTPCTGGSTARIGTERQTWCNQNVYLTDISFTWSTVQVRQSQILNFSINSKVSYYRSDHCILCSNLKRMVIFARGFLKFILEIDTDSQL